MYVHHSAGPQNQTPNSIQNYHMDSRGWSDIAYNWLVYDNGDIYEGRGWGVIGGATKGENSRSHSVCYVGNTQHDIPSDKAKQSINAIIDIHNKDFGSGYVKGHKDSAQANTACPGTHLINWIAAGRPVFDDNGGSMLDRTLRLGDTGADVRELQNMLNFWGHQAGTADGIFGPKTETAVKSFQTANKIAVDGIWGPESQKAYVDFLAAIGNPPPPVEPPPTKSEAELAREWVIEQGISDGTNPTSAATREQVWVMMYRLHGDG